MATDDNYLDILKSEILNILLDHAIASSSSANFCPRILVIYLYIITNETTDEIILL